MRREMLLRLLRRDSYVSGEAIAAKLGVTRAAVAKTVSLLRQDGYRIDAQPNRGYRLTAYPERLTAEAVRALLEGEYPAELIHVCTLVDSTNTELKRRAADNAETGTVLIAEAQTAGRGRMGRSFLSPPDTGIYCSILLRPQERPEALLTLTAQAAVAVCRAVSAVCGIFPDIKWVNDLQLNGKKICGILTELSVEAESGRVAYAVVGAGINCNQSAEDFPAELQGIAGSVYSETGTRVDRNLLAAALIQELSRLPAAERMEEYRAHCVTLGKPIVIHQGGQTREAVALDLGPRAELLVAYPDGSTGTINSGEVSIRTR